jgi:hypothetical protein
MKNAQTLVQRNVRLNPHAALSKNLLKQVYSKSPRYWGLLYFEWTALANPDNYREMFEASVNAYLLFCGCCQLPA